jgi:hypothetical protein
MVNLKDSTPCACKLITCRHVGIHAARHELLLSPFLNSGLVIESTIRIAAADERPVLCDVHNANDGIQRRECVPSNGAAGAPSHQCAEQHALPCVRRIDEANVCKSFRLSSRVTSSPSSAGHELGRQVRRRLEVRIPPSPSHMLPTAATTAAALALAFIFVVGGGDGRKVWRSGRSHTSTARSSRRSAHLPRLPDCYHRSSWLELLQKCTSNASPQGVCFDSQLEYVKLFLAEQKPLAVSWDGSPMDTMESEFPSCIKGRSDRFKVRPLVMCRVDVLTTTVGRRLA